MHALVALVCALQILDREKTGVDTFALLPKQVVEAAPRLVTLDQLVEELVKEGRLHDLLHTLALVNNLFHEALEDD